MTSFARMRDAFIPDREPLSALFCTYGFDTRFFEAEILPALFPDSLRLDREAGSTDTYLNAADNALARTTVSVFYDHLMGDGPELVYGTWAVRVGQRAFHPKLTVLDYGDVIRVIIGSANVTRAAWSSLLELFLVEDLVPGESHPWQAGVLDFVTRLQVCIPERQASQRDALLGGLRRVKPARGASRVTSSWEGPLLDAALEGVPSVRHIDIVTPFFEGDDGNGVFDELYERVGVAGTLHVATTDRDGRPKVSGPPTKLARLTTEEGWELRGVRATPWEGDEEGARLRALHGKLLALRHRDGARVMVGSANITRAALLREVPTGNVEIVVLADVTTKQLDAALPQADRLDPTQVDFVEEGDPTHEDDETGAGPERHVYSASYYASAKRLELVLEDGAPQLSVCYAGQSLGAVSVGETWQHPLELGVDRYITVEDGDGDGAGIVPFVVLDPEALAPRGAAVAIGLEDFFDVLAGYREFPVANDGPSRDRGATVAAAEEEVGARGAIPWRRYLAAVHGLGRELEAERHGPRGTKFCIDNPTRLAGLRTRLEDARDDRRFTAADLLYALYELEREVSRVGSLQGTNEEAAALLRAEGDRLKARLKELAPQAGVGPRRQVEILEEMDR